jgi:predicted RNase H-like HicB family nuclease
MSREFYVTIEKDEDGFFVGEVPQLKACYSQGKTIDELMVNMKEVIALALEEQGDVEPAEFVGVQKLMVNV